jgi:hypothetical protein
VVPTPPPTTKAAPPQAPEIGLVSDITSDSAILEGRLKREAHVASWHFEYAPGSNCAGIGARSTPEEEEAPQSEPVLEVHAEITGLKPSTIYALCLIVRNAGGSTLGQELTIKTLPVDEGNDERQTEVTTSTSAPVGPIGPALTPILPATPPTAALPIEASKPAAKPLTRIQLLAVALKACRKDKRKRKRAACERRARRRYEKPHARKRESPAADSNR